jgi:type VI secretion system protein
VREERLLERIRTYGREPERRGREDVRRINDSVLRHLQRILNTRQGNVPIAGDYGVPDFSDLVQAGAESVRDLEKSLRAVIQKYEPRLKSVRVIFVPGEEDALSLRFQVVARLVADSRAQVLFDTYIDPGRKIRLKG